MKQHRYPFIRRDRMDPGIFTVSGLADALRSVFLTAGFVWMYFYASTVPRRMPDIGTAAVRCGSLYRLAISYAATRRYMRWD